MNKHLPPKDLVRRRLLTLIRLLNEEVTRTAGRNPPADGLTRREMRDWAAMCANNVPEAEHEPTDEELLS